jgi:site-specific DNA recombinase
MCSYVSGIEVVSAMGSANGSEASVPDAYEIAHAEGAVQRYYGAFESGGLPETRFLNRVQALETRLTELRARLEDLRQSDRTEVLVAPTAEVMSNFKETLRDAMLNGTPGQRKALLKELVVEVRVEGRDCIVPNLPASHCAGSRYGSSGGPWWTRTKRPGRCPQPRR